MGARGKAWARETLGWDAIGRSMRDAYQRVLDGRRRLRHERRSRFDPCC